MRTRRGIYCPAFICRKTLKRTPDSQVQHTYKLLPNRRWMTWVPLVTMGIISVIVFVMLSGTDVWWWSFLILAPAILLAILLTLGFMQLRLEIDGSGLRYHGVGYRIDAAWPQVSYAASPRPALLVTGPMVQWAPWLGWMFPVVQIFQPHRAGFARAAMNVIPLSYFDDGTLEAMVTRNIAAARQDIV